MTGFVDRVRLLLQGRSQEPGVSGQSNRQTFPKQTKSGGARWAEQDEDLFSPDKAGHKSSPQNNPQQSRSFVTVYYVWGTLALLMTGFAIGGVVWHFGPLFSQRPSAESVRLPDPMRALPEDTKTALLSPAPELAAQLKRSFLGKPDAICSELNELGLGNSGWNKAPFKRDRWQCASDLVPLTTPSVDFGSTTLFFLLRGPSEDKIDYLRLKLVVEDLRQKSIGLDAVWLVIDSLSGRYGWTVPDAFRQAIADFSSLWRQRTMGSVCR